MYKDRPCFWFKQEGKKKKKDIDETWFIFYIEFHFLLIITIYWQNDLLSLPKLTGKGLSMHHRIKIMLKPFLFAFLFFCFSYLFIY